MQGVNVLNSVIQDQWNYGLGSLPSTEFSHLFRTKLEDLLKKSIKCKKNWLQTVKLGRSLHKDIRAREDEFDTNNALRLWIGLPRQKPK